MEAVKDRVAETVEDQVKDQVEDQVEPVSEVQTTSPHQDTQPAQETSIVRVPGDLALGGSDDLLQILAMIQSGQLPLTDGIENALAARLLPPPIPMATVQPRGQQDLLAVALMLGAGLLGLCLAGILIAKMGDSSRDRGYQSSISNLVEQNSRLAKETRSSCIGIFITCPAPAQPVEADPAPVEPVQPVQPVEPVPQTPAAHYGTPVMAAEAPDSVEAESQLSEADLRFYRKSYAYWQQLRRNQASVKQMRGKLRAIKSYYNPRQFGLIKAALNDFITTL